MDPITALALTETVQGVSNTVRSLTQEEAPKTTEGAEGFDAVLRNMLQPDQANSINEEELFAALISERLGKHAGAEAAAAYEQALGERKAALTRADGYINVEQAANEALQGLVTEGIITEDTAAKVKKESFTAAQLDDNKTALYDGRGGASDPTIAVMNMEAALIQAQQIIESIESGETEAEEPATDGSDTASLTDSSSSGEGEEISASATGDVDGAGGFLLKPESEHHKKMVILLPAALAQEVQEVLLKDENGQTIERGVSSGYANPDQNGEREHIRFTKAGSDYPANITVEVKLADGTIREYFIPDPAQRND